MEVAPDFYSYFQAMRQLLATDKKLWCVSAWNDNGKEVFIDTDDIGKIILPIFNRYGTCTCIVSFNECMYIVCLMGVPIVSGESGYRGSLNVLVHSPANQQTL